MERDVDYLNRRAVAERQAALASDKAGVRLRHLEFAMMYEFRLREIQSQEQQAMTKLVEAA